jgi:hypothetical protein
VGFGLRTLISFSFTSWLFTLVYQKLQLLFAPFLRRRLAQCLLKINLRLLPLTTSTPPKHGLSHPADAC